MIGAFKGDTGSLDYSSNRYTAIPSMFPMDVLQNT